MKSTKLKHLPNMITFCNMGIGVVVVYLAMHNSPVTGIKLSCFLIFIAAVLDFLDGHLARYLNASSEMGKQLDSLADFVTFGIAPISIFLSQIGHLPWWIMFTLAIYPAAGGFRLARYNIEGYRKHITGLPITVSGFVLTTVSIINNLIAGEYTTMFVTIYLMIVLTLSTLMVSSIRIKRIK